MNENEIARKINEFGTGLPRFERRARKPKVTGFAIYAAAAILVGVTVFVSIPRAQASGFQEMVFALKGVRTMEAITYSRHSDGTYFPIEHQWMSGSKLAVEAKMNGGMHMIAISTPTDYIVNLMAMGVTTREPDAWDPFHGKTTALDWVTEDNDFGVVGAERTMKRLDSPSLNGRKAYILRYEKSKEPSRTVETIWVDSQTNLPIRCSVQESDHITLANGTTQDHHSDIYTDYQFDLPVSDSIFAPRFSPVVDVAARQTELVRKWQAEPLAKGRKATVLDAQVSNDGSLYLLYPLGYAPAEVKGARGEKYVKAADYQPGGVRGDTKTDDRLSEFGKPIWGAVFVPTKLGNAHEQSFEVTFRPVAQQGWLKIETGPGPSETLSFSARDCMNWPDYAFDLVLATYFLQVDMSRALAQAKALESAGDIDSALTMYLEAFERQKQIPPPHEDRSLVPAEAMLRRVGRSSEADALRVQIEASRVNRGLPK